MDDNMLRLESVEFEDWGASRISGKFDVDQRTFIYGGDPDAFREILRALRRGLGIVEEALNGVYPRLESVEFENWGASRIGGKFDGVPQTLLYDVARALFAKLSTRFVAGSESSKKRWTASIRVWQASSSRTGARVGFATSSTSTRERFRDALREILRLLRRGLGIVEETRDGVYPRLASVEFEDWGANRIGGNFDGAPRTLLYDVAPDAFREILRAIRRGLEIVEETLERRRRI